MKAAIGLWFGPVLIDCSAGYTEVKKKMGRDPGTAIFSLKKKKKILIIIIINHRREIISNKQLFNVIDF